MVLRDAAAVERSKAQEKEARAKESLAPELFGLLAGDAEDAKFRRITSPATMRDLNPLMQLRMQQVCFFLSVTTPFGRRMIDIITQYIVGEGFRPHATDPAVQQVIDRFWEDPINNMDENVEAFAHELLVFGELVLPVSVNPVDGFTRVGYIDPQEIENIEFGLLQTAISQEVTVPVAVRLVRHIGENIPRRLAIVHNDEDVNSASFGQKTGDCFYYAINKAKAASRGISEIFALADWIDVFDQMMFDFADRVRLLNSFVWHYVVKGGDGKSVEKLKELVTKNPPRQGGVQVTNDRVEINAETPDLRGQDMSEASRVVKLYGLGGIGLPPWFFADPQMANRSIAEEMGGPTQKMLTSKQNVMKRVVTNLVDFALEQAVAHGVLPQGIDLSWNLDVPDLSVKDIQKASTALGLVVNACAIAEEKGWLKSETAARSVHTILTQLGVEVDTDEFDQAQQEKTTRDAANQDLLNPQKNLADALKTVPGVTNRTDPGTIANTPPEDLAQLQAALKDPEFARRLDGALTVFFRAIREAQAAI